jgi:hypothetical protein
VLCAPAVVIVARLVKIKIKLLNVRIYCETDFS